jgi:acyl-coenzyme A synthetase/AMP-(fatty) acid ligase
MLYDSQYLTSGESDMDAMDQESDLPTVQACAGTGSPLSPYFKSRAKNLLQHQRSDSFARSDTGSIASRKGAIKPRSGGSDGDGTCVLAVDAVEPDMERESESDVRMQTANGWYAMLNLRPSSSSSVG